MAINAGKCQCEHHSHFASGDEAVPRLDPRRLGHPYGEVKDNVVLRQTPMGKFAVCSACFQANHMYSRTGTGIPIKEVT